MATVALQVRMSAEEYAAVVAMAQESGLSLSEFCRRRLRSSKIVTLPFGVGDEQKAAAPAMDEASQGSRPDGSAFQDYEVQEAGAVREVLPADSAPVEFLGGFPDPVAMKKPKVFQAVGSYPPAAFRLSKGCTNSRCGRLNMPLCDPCRKVNAS